MVMTRCLTLDEACASINRQVIFLDMKDLHTPACMGNDVRLQRLSG